MARRASSSTQILPLVIIGGVLLIAFAVGVSLLNKKKDPFGKLPALPVYDATENGNSLRGNIYQVNGKVEERWVKNNYEGLHLSVEENGVLHPIFIQIPNDLERPNLERERHYSFSVQVGPGGIIKATGIQRL